MGAEVVLRFTESRLLRVRQEQLIGFHDEVEESLGMKRARPAHRLETCWIGKQLD